MNSLSQYLELYTGNLDAIERGSAEVINRLRGNAFDALTDTRMPERGDENYERTSLNDMFAADRGVNINRVKFPTDISSSFRCDVPNMSTLLGVVVNDQFHPTRTLLSGLPEGVTFMSLCQAARQYPDLVGRYYGSLANLSEPQVALNTLLVQDGVFIHVAKGVRLDKPLQLVNIFNSPVPTLAPRRVLVVMEADSSAKLLVCDHTQTSEIDQLSSEVVEVFLEPGARLDYYTIEESSAATSRCSNLFVKQQERSVLSAGNISLTCGTTRNNLSIDLVGSGSEAKLAGMVIGSGRQHVDNAVVLRHLAPHCTSRQMFKYLLDGESTGSFGGLILVTPAAQYTDASQTDRNLLASTGARMHAKPQLEIYNDDVKCSHGATTGQLDQEALFYMRTRGIPEQEARMLLMQAFMADVIDMVEVEELRDRLRHLVERRLNGNDSSCSDCHTSCSKALNK